MQDKERAATYALLARALAFPGPDLKAFCKHAVEGDVALGETAARLVRLGLDTDLDRLQDQYVTLFGHVIRDVSPYETEYGNAHIFQQVNEMSDIAGFYGAFGLQFGAGERPDHVAVELEFMAYLSLRHALAADERIRDAQRKFLSDHLGRWGALLGRMIRSRSDAPFYQAAGELLDQFVTAECARFAAAPSEFREVDLRKPDYEPEGGCFSCGAADQCFPGAQGQEELE